MITYDFFRARLDTMIAIRHPLAAVLAARMPWTQIEAALQPMLVHRGPAKLAGERR